jgi:TIR domain
MAMAENKYDVFLSYHWRDHAYVEGIARALRNRGLHVFLDRWYLHPGRPWPQELETVMQGCRSVAVCVGPGEMGPWQQREMNMALERQAQDRAFPVVPVLLPGADPVLGFLGQNTWIDLRDQLYDSTAIDILAGATRGEPPGPDACERIEQTVNTICPYRGLQYFREEDAPFFFGRDAAIKQLLDMANDKDFFVVVGASGCGKSSVIRAGLLPALRHSRGAVWEIATIVPGDRPFYALSGVLLPLLDPDKTETDRLVEINKLSTSLEQGDLKLRDVVDRVLTKQQGTERLLLVVDQWEELYSITPKEVSRCFIDELLTATAHIPLSIVLTVRGDFAGYALAYRPLSDRLQGAQINLGPMNREELTAAVMKPAERVGLSFESGLVERILDDAGDEPGNLPLLEFVLKQLWDNRNHGQLLHAAYDGMGRLQGAVANKADDI